MGNMACISALADEQGHSVCNGAMDWDTNSQNSQRRPGSSSPGYPDYLDPRQASLALACLSMWWPHDPCMTSLTLAMVAQQSGRSSKGIKCTMQWMTQEVSRLHACQSQPITTDARPWLLRQPFLIVQHNGDQVALDTTSLAKAVLHVAKRHRSASSASPSPPSSPGISSLSAPPSPAPTPARPTWPPVPMSAADMQMLHLQAQPLIHCIMRVLAMPSSSRTRTEVLSTAVQTLATWTTQESKPPSFASLYTHASKQDTHAAQTGVSASRLAAALSPSNPVVDRDESVSVPRGGPEAPPGLMTGISADATTLAANLSAGQESSSKPPSPTKPISSSTPASNTQENAHRGVRGHTSAPDALVSITTTHASACNSTTAADTLARAAPPPVVIPDPRATPSPSPTTLSPPILYTTAAVSAAKPHLLMPPQRPASPQTDALAKAMSYAMSHASASLHCGTSSHRDSSSCTNSSRTSSSRTTSRDSPSCTTSSRSTTSRGKQQHSSRPSGGSREQQRTATGVYVRAREVVSWARRAYPLSDPWRELRLRAVELLAGCPNNAMEGPKFGACMALAVPDAWTAVPPPRVQALCRGDPFLSAAAPTPSSAPPSHLNFVLVTLNVEGLKQVATSSSRLRASAPGITRSYTGPAALLSASTDGGSSGGGGSGGSSLQTGLYSSISSSASLGNSSNNGGSTNAVGSSSSSRGIGSKSARRLLTGGDGALSSH